MPYSKENEPKLYEVIAPLVIARIMLYGGWKYMTNQSAKVRTEGLETRVMQTNNFNNSKNIGYENKSDYSLK